MTRKLYELTEEQKERFARFSPRPIPTDDEFKAKWADSHRGKTAGWGVAKRDFMLAQLRITPEYHRGLWQGRVDAARGIPYSEERNQNAYNLGYYQGYTNYHSDRRGWTEKLCQEFDANWCSEN